jgi:phage regulator Rha-like protein
MAIAFLLPIIITLIAYSMPRPNETYLNGKNSTGQMTLVHETDKMTSLQIADITGKMHKDVLESIRKMEKAWVKVTGRNFPLSEYTDATGRKLPMYELSKQECLYIATKFNDESRAKLVIRWEKLETEKQLTKPLSQAEMFLQNAQLMVEHDRRLNDVENKLHVLESKTQTLPDYFTIVGYGTLHRISVNLKQASSLGRKASELCKRRGIETDRIPDPRFGEVKMYPRHILDEVFDQPLIR